MGARRGYAAVDVLVSGLTLSVLAILLVVTGKQSRGNAQQAGSMANLHEFAAVTASYHADYGEQYWSFNWKPGDQGRSQFEDLNTALMGPINSTYAAAIHAADIARRRGIPDFPGTQLATWLPSVSYGHWILSEYLDQSLLLRFAVSPGDRLLKQWSNDPEGFRAGLYPPAPGQGEPMNARYAYATSYRMGPAFYSPDYSVSSSSPAPVVLGGGLGAYTFGTGRTDAGFGRRLATEVKYPSQKVFMFDNAQWSGAKSPLLWAQDQARVPMLFVDGSVQVRVTGRANAGFNPNSPQSPFGYIGTYTPAAWEPGLAGNYMMRFYFTRGGLSGRDYDGTEPSGPPF